MSDFVACVKHDMYDMLTYTKCIICGFTLRHEEQGRKQGRLVLLGTEIGNPFDITPRVLDAILTANYIVCEHADSFKKLCITLGITPKGVVCPYKDFSNEEDEGIENLQWLYDEIQSGLNAIMIADQGMPFIMDPSDYIVKGAIERNIPVSIFPGPDAPVTALNVSGLNAWDFTFIGSIPYDFQKRNTIFSELNNDNKTNIYFDRDHHLLDNLTHLSKVIGEYRKIAVCFNMTRSDQHILRGTIKEVKSWLLQNGYDKPRQDAEWLVQITVVVEGNEPQRPHI
jgi:16S rRNA (cytidine1402-2'-O)-methyltransferase